MSVVHGHALPHPRRCRAVLLAAVLAGPAACTREPVASPALVSEGCSEHFAGGRRPALLRPQLASATTPLCFRGFATLHSGVSRTAVYAAEHLTAARIAAARGLDRTDAFHEEDGLPRDAGASLADYVGSGYDRGHLAPSGDMPDDLAQRQSFSLANIVPQDPDDNRGLWSDVEGAVRGLAVARGEVYVVTGPIFLGATVGSLKGRVLIPTQLFKAVYDPARRVAAAYVVPNAPGREWRAVSLEELRQLAGLDVFPGAAVEDRLRLPAPAGRSAAHHRRRDTSGWFDAALYRVLRTLWRETLRAVLG